MDDVLFMGAVRKIFIFVSVIGILAGLDLLFGAKTTSNLKNILDRAMVNLDKAMFTVRTRLVLGVLFLLISVLIISLVISTR